MGALLQHLPTDAMDNLRRTGRTQLGKYRYRIIVNKMLSISTGHNYVTIYDIMQYYGHSLDYNARKYLGDAKLDADVKLYTNEYVNTHWDEITRYCIHDAELTQRLAMRLIQQCESWGMPVRKLYSTAWISYAWFASKCGHPTVKQYWLYDRTVLDYAMAAYNGGKFEVTRKGAAHLYEYDIVSAYPSSIANLVDLYHSGVKWSTTYQPDAVYAYIDCSISIPPGIPSPVAHKLYGVNTYPAGEWRKIITKCEYDYYVRHNIDITIHSACWIIPDRLQYPYRDEIYRLVALKQSYKSGDPMAYHTVKIILNSLYGKFVQLTPMIGGKWRAGSSWNPIYGSVITAETRVRVTELQLQYPSIWAVHTDSVISNMALPYVKSNVLGGLGYETDGNGIIIASGIYEIGDKTAIRGIPSRVSLAELSHRGGRRVDVSSMQPITWRQTLQRHYDHATINRWIEQTKHLRCDMDRKRIWIDDWTDWSEVTQRVVDSVPYLWSKLLYR